jgi:hypothetical protein
MMKIDTRVKPSEFVLPERAWSLRTWVAACALVALEGMTAFVIYRHLRLGAIFIPTFLGYAGIGAYFLFRSSLFSPFDDGRGDFFERVRQHGKVTAEGIQNLYKNTSVTRKYVVDLAKETKASCSIGDDICVACAKGPVTVWYDAAVRSLIDAAEEVERYASAVGYRVQQHAARRYRLWQVVVALMRRGDEVLDLSPYENYIENGAGGGGFWVGHRLAEVIDKVVA